MHVASAGAAAVAVPGRSPPHLRTRSSWPSMAGIIAHSTAQPELWCFSSRFLLVSHVLDIYACNLWTLVLQQPNSNVKHA